ncbi:MAG: sulfite exporter TauE/SafE family protein [Myxococcota bacterium]|nr:sulfite exporter TauE/SafE family protein [Myxococcota bacterium]
MSDLNPSLCYFPAEPTLGSILVHLRTQTNPSEFMSTILDWLPVTPTVYGVAFLVTSVAATLQATIGFGFAVLSVPVLSLIDPRLAPVPQLLLIAPLAVSMAWRERAALDLKGLGWVLLGRGIGAGLGVLLLKVASQFILDISIAAVVMIAVISLTLIQRIPRNAMTELIAGTVSGTGALVSSIGGPPLALLYRDSGGGTLRSSLATIFIIGLFVTIGARVSGGLISQTDIVLAVFLVPAIGVGLYASRFLIGRIEGEPFRKAVLAVASVSAIGLMVRALMG